MPAQASRGSGYIVSYQDEAILRSLNRYHFLLSRQLCRLHYAASSMTYVQARLKRLVDAGLCQRLWLPKRGRYGSAPAVYTLARAGINHIRNAGAGINRRYRPSEQEARSYLFLQHTLDLNDFLISAELLARWAPEFRLAAMLHERELKRHPVKVNLDSGGKVAVIPDAWLDIRIQGGFQVCLAVELDRGTEERWAWRSKVANLLAYANGPYQETFETRSITFAIVTTAGSRRLADLLSWTQSELTKRKEQSQADLFLFAYFEPERMDAEQVFLLPCWSQPFADKPVALLESNWSS